MKSTKAIKEIHFLEISKKCLAISGLCRIYFNLIYSAQSWDLQAFEILALSFPCKQVDNRTGNQAGSEEAESRGDDAQVDVLRNRAAADSGVVKLDKDLFRQDLSDIIPAYEEIASRLESLL